MNVLIRGLPKSLDQRIKLTQESENFASKSEAIIYLLSKQFESEAPLFFDKQLIENQKLIQNILERNQLILNELLEEIKGGNH